MPEIKPDLSDSNRCISVHWTLPVQCVLPSSHRENWHEAWHPQNGNRLRYQRSMGGYATEELLDGWRDLEIPPPGGFCNDQYSGHFGDANVRCTGQYGHGWNHRAVVDGCTYSWNTPIPNGLTVDHLTRDVKQLRGMLITAHSRIAALETDLDRVRDERDRARRIAVTLEQENARLEDEAAEQRAAQDPTLRCLLVKATKDRDQYVGWSRSCDAPTGVWSRETALGYGFPRSKVDRADANGSSDLSCGDGHWDDKGWVAEQRGWLPRHMIGDYAIEYLHGDRIAAYAMLQPLNTETVDR